MGINLMSMVTDAFSKYRGVTNALGDGFRPYNFKGKISLPEPLSDLQPVMDSRSILLKEASLPETSLKTVKTSIYGREVAIPVMLNTNNETTLEFYLDDALITRDIFDFWMKCMDKSLSTEAEMKDLLGGILTASQKGGWENYPGSFWDMLSLTGLVKAGIKMLMKKLGGNTEGTPQYFTGEIQIETMDNINLRTSKYVYKNVYPIRIEAVRLNSSEVNSIGSIRISFYYTHCLRGDMTLIDSVKEMAKDQFRV